MSGTRISATCKKSVRILALTIGSIAGCKESQPLATQLPMDQIVTPDLASRLTATGKFTLATGDSSQGELGEQRAKDLALEYWRAGYRGLEFAMSRDRGGPIHSADLVPCERAYYAASAYASVPSDVPAAVKRILGAHWLVGLCYQGIQEIVISVAADVQQRPPSSAGLFQTRGVPVGTEIPIAPESIALMVAGLTGRRVSTEPVLIKRPRPKAPAMAVWQVELELPVVVTGVASGNTRAATTLFAGHLNGWMQPALALARPGVPANSDPAELVRTLWVESDRNASYRVTRRASLPHAFELVTVGGQ